MLRNAEKIDEKITPHPSFFPYTYIVIIVQVHLEMRNLSVFLDVSTLEAGPFTNNLLDNIRGAHSFVLVLTEAALDRCFGDLDQRDWIHKEVRSDTTVISVGFFYFFQYA